jgi:hypothetical protein
MTRYRFWNFALTSLDTGHVLASAIVCPRAQYVTLHWTGTSRIERRQTSALVWRAVADQLARTLRPGSVERITALTALLAGARAPVVTVRYLDCTDVTATPEDVSAVLDARLRRDAVGDPVLALLDDALDERTQ